MTEADSVENRWHFFMMRAELARNYKLISRVGSLPQAPTPNPVLEKLLPSLLYIALGSFMDETFAEYIADNGLPIGKPYRNDLNGRIRFLNDRSLIPNADDLHQVRQARNGLAHNPMQTCTWSELNAAIVTAHTAFSHLGLVGPMPKYELFYGREPSFDSKPGVAVSMKYHYGLKRDGLTVYEMSWALDFEGWGKTE